MNEDLKSPSVTVEEPLPGLWGWAARHPEWHPGDFGATVWSWALRAGEDALLVDPLVPDDAREVWALIERLAATRRLAILITIPYHVRSSAEVRERFGGDVDVTIHGHAAAAKRLPSRKCFHEIEPGKELPGGAVAHAIGRPERYERPLHLQSHDALAFGDAIVGTEDGLRIWTARELDARRERFLRDRFAPTLAPLAQLRPANVLVAHGPSAFGDGAEQLQRALTATPWYHPG